MSLRGCWWGACVLVLGGCSVPSLGELIGAKTLPLSVSYSNSFTKGCLQLVARGVGSNGDQTEVTLDDPSRQLSPWRPTLLRRDEWKGDVEVSLRAREQDCRGIVVEEHQVMFAVGDAQERRISLAIVDADGDGYISSSRGGSDCDDGDVMRNPSQQEICDDKDNNCAGGVDEGLPLVAMFRDLDGDGVGGEAIQHCAPAAGIRGYAMVGGDCRDDNGNIAPGKTEVCDNEDNNCDGNTDEIFDKYWYLDDDGDGVPRAGATVQCDSPGVKYKHYPAGPPFDCNDGDASSTPGKVELCDNKDNNCDGNVDETFPTKGDACNNLSCTGTLACNIPQNGLECSARAPRMFYPDRDQDGDGELDATVDEVCEGENPQPSHVENLHGDCDDVDPASRTGRAEVCDGIDNDCNGQVDDGLSCGTLKQVPSYHVRFESDAHDWLTVATHPSGYPVWIAGRNGKLAVRKSAAAKFESFSFGDATTTPPDGSPVANTNNCGDRDWLVSWVDSAGVVYLAGETGSVAFHDGTVGSLCAVGGVPTSEHVTGMMGFERNGSKLIYLTDTAGRLFRWVVGGAITELDDHNVNYYGVHGVREEALLVVGGATGGALPGQRFFSYAVTPGGAATRSNSHTYLPGNISGNARAVWMGTETTACAVGDNGAVWRWNGTTTWSRVLTPGASTDPFTSVVMRNDGVTSPQRLLAGHCYIVDGSANGRLRRLTPYGWANGPAFQANVPLNDIAITATGDIWIVGEDGRVFHYPEPTPP